MLKMGVPVASAPVVSVSEKQTVEKPAVEESAVDKKAEVSAAPKADTDGSFSAYEAWGRVLERIGEIKKSLSSQFVSAKVQRKGNIFKIAMSEFFARRINENAADMAIVRGVISEIEGINPTDVVLTVEAKTAAKANDLSSELEKILN